mgnify:CR=1 FL=1
MQNFGAEILTPVVDSDPKKAAAGGSTVEAGDEPAAPKKQPPEILKPLSDVISAVGLYGSTVSPAPVDTPDGATKPSSELLACSPVTVALQTIRSVSQLADTKSWARLEAPIIANAIKACLDGKSIR